MAPRHNGINNVERLGMFIYSVVMSFAVWSSIFSVFYWSSSRIKAGVVIIYLFCVLLTIVIFYIGQYTVLRRVKNNPRTDY